MYIITTYGLMLTKVINVYNLFLLNKTYWLVLGNNVNNIYKHTWHLCNNHSKHSCLGHTYLPIDKIQVVYFDNLIIIFDFFQKNKYST